MAAGSSKGCSTGQGPSGKGFPGSGLQHSWPCRTNAQKSQVLPRINPCCGIAALRTCEMRQHQLRSVR